MKYFCGICLINCFKARSFLCGKLSQCQTNKKQNYNFDSLEHFAAQAFYRYYLKDRIAIGVYKLEACKQPCNRQSNKG